jgi:hypothetical protein
MNIEQRKDQFKADVSAVIQPQESDHLDLEEFIEYWTETGGLKMRFELAKHQPFNINRRWGTWKGNKKRWATQRSQPSQSHSTFDESKIRV